MARVIQFYVPQNFRAGGKKTPVEQWGKVIEFPQILGRKSA